MAQQPSCLLSLYKYILFKMNEFTVRNKWVGLLNSIGSFKKYGDKRCMRLFLMG